MKLLDYHRLRNDEEGSWNRERMRREAGAGFISTAESLLPMESEPWSKDRLVDLKPAPCFDSCPALCALYRAATPDQRSWLRSRIDRKTGGRLHVFALRSSVLAARRHDPALSSHALTAYVIPDLVTGDIRDVLIGFALVCHCAALSGADVPALLREEGALAGPAMQALYEEWAARYPNVASIESMWWQTVDTPDGPGFRHG